MPPTMKETTGDMSTVGCLRLFNVVPSFHLCTEWGAPYSFTTKLMADGQDFHHNLISWLLSHVHFPGVSVILFWTSAGAQHVPWPAENAQGQETEPKSQQVCGAQYGLGLHLPLERAVFKAENNFFLFHMQFLQK
jgi:hypothetical protein